MAEAITIAAEPRERAGKGAARAARRAGKVPAVIYGEKQPPLAVNFDVLEINRLLKDPAFTTHLFSIELDGRRHSAIPRDVQYHPVTDDVLHLDFLRVGEKTLITVGVPVQFVNDQASPGLKRGGMLNIVRYEVELVCPAGAIPEALTVDLTGWQINDSIHISAVTLPEGTRPAIADRDFTIATISAPSGLKSEAAAEEE
jgi:large subunit ribosomal protein L25